MTAFCAFVITASTLLGQAEATQSAMPDNVRKELDFFVGQWSVEGEIGGEAFKGRWSARWSHHKHCLLVSSDFTLGDERVYASGFSGWNAADQQLVTMTLFSNGVLEDIRYKSVSPGQLKGIYTVSTGEGPTQSECVVRTESPDEWTFESSVSVFGQKEKEKFVLHVVRLKEEAKKNQKK